MPAIKILATCLALAAALAAQSNLVVKGLEAYNKGDYITAERSFRAALDQGGDVRARSLLALVQASTGRCADAEPALTTDQTDPALAKLTGLALARCRIAAGRLDDAAVILKRLREKDPADPD